MLNLNKIFSIIITSTLVFILFGCNNNQPDFIRIELPTNKILWKGLNLPLEINSSNEASEFLVQLSKKEDAHTKITRKSKNQFTVFTTQNRNIKLDIFIMRKNREIYLFSEILKVKEIPNLKPIICSGASQKISNAMINSCKKIKVETINYDIDANFKVIGFDIVTHPPKQGRIVNSSKNNLLTAPQIQQIKELRAGEFIYVENIVAEISGGQIREIEILKLEKI